MYNYERDYGRDYGRDVSTARGARAHLRDISHRELTRGGYISIVGRLSGRRFDPVECDAVACGFGRWTPTELVAELDEWLAYYRAAQLRADTPGSPYFLRPDLIWTAWVTGLPSWCVAALWWRQAPDEDAVGSKVRPPNRKLGSRQLYRWRTMARAADRTSARGLILDAHCLWQLGRVSPEIQRAALERLPRHDGVLRRSRDLDWTRAAKVQRDIARDPSGRVRAAWATGKRRESLKVLGWEGPVSLLPQDSPYYASLKFVVRPPSRRELARESARKNPVKIIERLVRGESPKDISGCLTHSEAHRWLIQAPDLAPLSWLTGSPDCDRVLNPDVQAWCADLFRRGRWGLLTRERKARINGVNHAYRYIARLEELRARDVAGNPTPDQAFERAAERFTNRTLESLATDTRVISTLPKEWPPLLEGMRLLSTPADLVERGKTEHHCVGTRVPMVAHGEVWIIAIDTMDSRSTVELRRDRSVVEHRGPANSMPHVACTDIFNLWHKHGST